MSRNAAGLMTYHKAVIGVVAFILALPIVATVYMPFPRPGAQRFSRTA